MLTYRLLVTWSKGGFKSPDTDADLIMGKTQQKIDVERNVNRTKDDKVVVFDSTTDEPGPTCNT